MAVCIDVSASWRQVAGKLKVKTILQVSKIAAFVLTKRQINIKKDVSRENSRPNIWTDATLYISLHCQV